MTDTTPPPEEPLNDQARARIRADLLASAQDGPSGSRRWAVPLAAAASVVLVAGLTAVAVGRGGGDPETGAPGGQSVQPTSTPSEVVPPGDDTDPPSIDPPTSGTPDDVVQVGTGTCPVELENVLKGAKLVATFPEEGGATSVWVKDNRFSICDIREGTTTVHQPLPLDPDLDDRATFRVSSVYPPTDDGYKTVRLAAGIVPEGALAFDVAYTFPDGHVEKATTTTDTEGRTWWRMKYEYDDGGGNEMKKPPIEVSVTLSGSGFGFTLVWGEDTCAQANHGC